MSDSFATLWTVAYQAPLPIGFPGRNTEVGCHFLLQGIFLTQGSQFLTTEPPGKPCDHLLFSHSVVSGFLYIDLYPIDFRARLGGAGGGPGYLQTNWSTTCVHFLQRTKQHQWNLQWQRSVRTLLNWS